MHILISGISRGIGAAVVEQLCRQGHQVIGLSSSLVAMPMDFPHFRLIQADLAKESAESLAEKIALQTDKLDILINNAGVLFHQPFAETTLETWQRTFDINLFGAVKLIQATLPLLRQSAQAHIVNIGSMGGFQGSAKFAGLAAYSGSKAALANLTECLAEELKPQIHVNCLALGAVNTEMLATAFPGYEAPLSAEEMAKYVCNFALQQRAFFNGKIIPVAVNVP